MDSAATRINGIRRLLGTWQRRRRFRAELRRLLNVGDDIVRDIGLTPEDARRESCKPFWRA